MFKNYFAAANTSLGFMNFFDKVFDRSILQYVYVIQGAPGTGKSTMMKRFREHFTSLGCECDTVLCSSDPSSVDGVIVRDIGIAVIDGTSPHRAYTERPGYGDANVDLFPAFNVAGLRERAEELESLREKKIRLYTRAYACFSMAGKAEKMLFSLLDSALDDGKAAKYAQKLQGLANKGGARVKITSALSAQGEIELLPDNGSALKLKGKKGTGAHFVGRLREYIDRGGCENEYSPNMLSPSKADRFSVGNTFITSSKEEGSDVMRFYDKEYIRSVRGRLSLIEKTRDEMKKAGLECLKESAEAHLYMEKIYKENTDFSIIDEITEGLIKSAVSLIR